MLRKPAIVTVTPAEPGREYRPASYVCTPKPPSGTGGDSDPPDGGSTPSEYHVFVPEDPDNPAAGEYYQQFGEHPGEGYTCAMQAPNEFIVVRWDGGQFVIQNSVVCTWNYPNV